MTKIIEMSKCCGCSACVQACPKNCITMCANEEGFLYPKINEALCVKCNLCKNSCPLIMQSERKNQISAFAFKHSNEKIRLESSSGGAFTAIATKILESNGIVFGAAFNDKFEVEHSYIENINELYRFRGSKYVQSKIGNTYKQVSAFLNQGCKVLFTGTPCQIEGLLTYLRKDYDNLITQDLICHGVPSPLVWNEYIKFRRKKSDDALPLKISFRSKNEGWKKYSVLFSFDNNTEYQKCHHEDYMMQAFLQDMCLRESCYQCLFRKYNRQSDFTLADFWGINKVITNIDDDKGVSLIIVNTDKGHKLFQSISDCGDIVQVNLDIAILNNKSMVKSPSRPKNRDNFILTIRDMPFDKSIRKYCKQKSFKLLRKLKKKVLNSIIKV